MIKKLKFPCLVLDHDDTTVLSTPQVNYPAFLDTMKKLRPDAPHYDYETFIDYCCDPGFEPFFRRILGFNDEEMKFEFANWQRFVKMTIPEGVPGLGDVIKKYRDAGGVIFVVSHSYTENILRDWRHNFGILPDGVYAWDTGEGKRKPDPYPLLDIMKKNSFTADELIMVDDLKPGLVMSRAAGVRFAAAGWARQSNSIEAMMRRESDYYFESPNDLEELLFAK